MGKESAKNLTKLLLPGLLTAGAMAGCRTGGGVTTASAPSTPTASVSAPIIISPATSPYYSKSSKLLLTGSCKSGSVVLLNGSVSDQQLCIADSFQFEINQSNDGIYTFLVSAAGNSLNTSNPAALVWVKKSSVPLPIITSPTTATFASGRPVLTIEGSCETGATISLEIDAAGSVVCANSTFSIDVPKAADGDYTIKVVQTDPAGNSSNTTLIWQKHALLVTPNNPSLVVMVPQTLTFSGGAGSYTASITVNNSGATYNSTTRVYTPGPLANVVDTLVVTDSLGNQGTVYITTVAGDPDHFSLPATGSGANQTAYVGSPFTDAIRVRLVDRYENGIPARILSFRMTEGDAQFTSPFLLPTDASGYAQVTLRAGYTAVSNTVHVEAVGLTLVDAAGTGRSTLQISETTANNGTGKLGDSFPVAQNPGAVAVRDFNGDGLPDVAILNVGDNSVGILLAQGHGLLGTMTKIKPLCTGPNFIDAGDVNGDANLDLVIACSGSNKVAILIGSTTGVFAHASGSPFSTGATETIPTAAVIGDFDKDGKADIAVASAGGAVVGIWKGAGNGQFTAPAPAAEYSIGQSPSALVTVDINKDGWLDLVSANSADDTFSVLRNNGNGTFGAQAVFGTSSNPSALAVGDFDGDTFPDLAVLENGATQVSAFTNDGTGGMQLQSNNSVGASPTWLAVGDFDKDGKADIAVANGGDNTVIILKGAGNGNFTVSATVPTVTNPVFIATSDVTGDGSLDLVVSGNTDQLVQVIPGKGTGSFGFDTSSGTNPVAVARGDFDGDGKQDFAVANKGSNIIKLLKGKGNGFYTDFGSLSTGNSPIAIKSADLDGDGKLDLVVANNGAGSVRVYKGVGDGTFQTGVNYSVGSSPIDLLIVDLNEDGKLDILVANLSSSTVSYLKGIGDGSFMTKVDTQTGTGPVGISAADLNNDHHLDIVAACQTANSVGLLLGNGDGTLQAEVSYASGLGPIAIALGDVNHDGNADVLTANGVDNTLSVLLGNGDGSLRTKDDYSAGTTINGMVMGDFNGDSRPDIIVSNGVGNSLTLLPGSANGQYNSQTMLSATFSPSGIFSSDVNADGALDLIVFDGSNDFFQIWLGH